jgi:very-short-patch-repair endonuclease
MSYGNQRFHGVLDRRAIRDMLLAVASGQLTAGPVDHLDTLLAQCDSELERRWLHLVQRKGLRLPDEAQSLVPDCATRPDFLYRERMVAVYVDGPAHDFPTRQARDAERSECMTSLGYAVLRFGHEADWDALLDEHAQELGGSRREPSRPGEAASPPELDLFPGAWRPLIERLREEPDLRIEPGEDVVDGGVVVGMSAAQATLNGVSATLVDAADPAAPSIIAAVEDRGGLAFAVDASAEGAAAFVLAALRGT